jgi:hypothetical protein
MSIARVSIQASRKERVCEKCKAEVHPGDQYRAFKVGFRSRHVHVRCMKASCAPRNSELESSSLSEVYAAQEDFDVAIEEAFSTEELEAALEELSSAVQEYAYARREAADAWEYGNSQLEEAADEWENKASELEGCWSPDEYEPDESDDAEEDYDDRRAEWFDGQRDELRSAVESVLS